MVDRPHRRSCLGNGEPYRSGKDLLWKAQSPCEGRTAGRQSTPARDDNNIAQRMLALKESVSVKYANAANPVIEEQLVKGGHAGRGSKRHWKSSQKRRSHNCRIVKELALTCRLGGHFRSVNYQCELISGDRSCLSDQSATTKAARRKFAAPQPVILKEQPLLCRE